MPTRNVRKNLIGMRDLQQGVGEVSQDRNNVIANEGSLDLPYAVLTELEMQNLDITVFTRARVYNGTAEYIEYTYDPLATTGVASNTGAAFWVEIGFSSRNQGFKSVLYDFDVDGGAVSDIALGTIPNDATIIQAWYEVITAPTSGGSATIALGVDIDDAAGIKAATAFDDASFAAGYHDTLCDNTASTFTTKSTAVRDVILSIVAAVLTAGKIRIWFKFLRSE